MLALTLGVAVVLAVAFLYGAALIAIDKYEADRVLDRRLKSVTKTAVPGRVPLNTKARRYIL